MKKRIFFSFACSALLFLLFAKNVRGQQPENGIMPVVNSKEGLYAAARTAKAGDNIYLEDGVYKDVKLAMVNSGKTAKPIRIAAMHPGKVLFTGDASIELRGDNLVLDGIYFKDGARNPAEWSSHGPGLVAIYGSYNRITNCAFDAFDEANSAYITTSLTSGDKVPQHCRVDHCTFINKITFDQVINLNNATSAKKEGPGGPPMYHRIDHNFFSNPPKPGNAGGAIRIGYYRNDTGRCLVDSNLFMRQDSEPEIITSKSRENVYYANTYLNCQGTLNFRHGDNQVAVNNFFIGSDDQYGYGGMFVWGSGHIIASNYFELPKTISSRGNAALYLNPGAIGSEHALAFNLTIANNFFVNVNGYAIHFNPLDERRRQLCEQNQWKFDTPQDLTISGNLFYSNRTTKFTFFKNDYPAAHSFSWKNNHAFGCAEGMSIEGGAIKTVSFRLQKSSGVYRPLASLNYVPSILNGIRDIEGIRLDIQKLASLGVQGKPLHFDEVGVTWIKEIPPYTLTGKLPSELQRRLDRVLQRGK